MKSKVIYLCYLPLNETLENNFFINDLASSGIPVEYWDLSRLFFPDICFSEIEREYVKKISDYAGLTDNIQKNNPRQCLYVVMIFLSAQTARLFRILKKHNCFTIFFARCGIPANERKKSRGEIIQNCFNREKIRNKLINEVSCLMRNLGLIKRFDIVFASGSVECSSYPDSRVIPFNHFDYDNYLTLRGDSSRAIEDEYCVFLDDNLAYDTDLAIGNLKTVTPSLYFSSLRSFFDKLEGHYKLNVVIAAHPKANYRGNEFGNRKIIHNRTNELVKDCRFAVAHYSTSVSFPVLYAKPVLFIYTDEIRSLFCFPLIKTYAETLNSALIDIDHPDEVFQIQDLQPDLGKYDEYKYRYLTTEVTENQFSRDIFAAHIRRLMEARF